MGKNNQFGQIASIAAMAVASYFAGPLAGQLAFVATSIISQRLASYTPIEGARRGDLNGTYAEYGATIPEVFGYYRVPGNVIWCKQLTEKKTTEGGGKGSRGTNVYRYFANFACLLCNEKIVGIRRIWANGKLIYSNADKHQQPLNLGVTAGFHPMFSRLAQKTNSKRSTLNSQYGNIELFDGSLEQQPSSWIESFEGEGFVERYAGTAYVVFKDFELTEFGNTIPQLAFEIVKDDAITEDTKEKQIKTIELINKEDVYNSLEDDVKKAFFDFNTLTIDSFAKQNNEMLLLCETHSVVTTKKDLLRKYKVINQYSPNFEYNEAMLSNMLTNCLLVLKYNLTTKKSKLITAFLNYNSLMSQMLQTDDGYLFNFMNKDAKIIFCKVKDNLNDISFKHDAFNSNLSVSEAIKQFNNLNQVVYNEFSAMQTYFMTEIKNFGDTINLVRTDYFVNEEDEINTKVKQYVFNNDIHNYTIVSSFLKDNKIHLVLKKKNANELKILEFINEDIKNNTYVVNLTNFREVASFSYTSELNLSSNTRGISAYFYNNILTIYSHNFRLKYDFNNNTTSLNKTNDIIKNESEKIVYKTYVNDNHLITYDRDVSTDKIHVVKYNVETEKEEILTYVIDEKIGDNVFIDNVHYINNQLFLKKDSTQQIFTFTNKTISDELTSYLSTILEKLMKKAGLKNSQFNLDNIKNNDKKIRGFIINNASAIKDSLNALANVYAFNIVEKNGCLFFKYKSDEIKHIFKEEELGVDFYSDEIDYTNMYKKDTTKSLEIPSQISFNFVDEKLEYANNSVIASTFETNAKIVREISTALSLDVQTSKNVVEEMIHNFYASTETIETSVDIEYDYLNINDIVAIYFDDTDILKTYNITKKQKDKTVIKLNLTSCSLTNVKNIEIDNNFYLNELKLEQEKEQEEVNKINLTSYVIKLNKLYSEAEKHNYNIIVDYDEHEQELNKNYDLFINNSKYISNKRVDSVIVAKHNIKQLSEIEKQNAEIDKESYIIIKKTDNHFNIDFSTISLQQAVDDSLLNAIYFRNEVMRFLNVEETESEIKLFNFIRYVKNYNTFNHNFSNDNVLFKLKDFETEIIDIDLTTEQQQIKLEGEVYNVSNLTINNTAKNKLYNLTQDNFIKYNNKIHIVNILNPFDNNVEFNPTFIIKKSTMENVAESDILESFETQNRSFIVENLDNIKTLYIKYKFKNLESDFIKIE